MNAGRDHEVIVVDDASTDGTAAVVEYAVVPISWTNRTAGQSKLGLNEMGSRYLYLEVLGDVRGG